MFPGFDPSKLDPKMIQELTDLMRTLPPEKLMQMQSIMHNSMAGFDISKEMQAFESSLPGEFRLRLAKLMMSAGAIPDGLFTPPMGASSAAAIVDVTPSKPIESVDDARLTLLNAVRDGALSPEEALKALFS